MFERVKNTKDMHNLLSKYSIPIIKVIRRDVFEYLLHWVWFSSKYNELEISETVWYSNDNITAGVKVNDSYPATS